MVCRGVVAALSCLNFFLGCPTGDIAGLSVIDGHGTVEPYADAASVLNGYLLLVIIMFLYFEELVFIALKLVIWTVVETNLYLNETLTQT